ncbi:hypothetical protein [Flavobacterium kingsejongi]|uniref:Uncharacterized protein n=1 Tax=Flavobacterium kingsejongi TaxID=1678728 RepID=A0A2S1LL88_9FLAO|nr:hypothetical protein [Flavobacterium kingsejongi]AWG24524.1 hypothetical protein FK004_04370 [Flavobacterium kingsejongi]
MEEFKISIFEEEHSHSFPPYKTLSHQECENLQIKLARKYNIVKKNIVYELFTKQKYYSSTDASENFNLIDTLNRLWITSLNNVYIDWYGFQRIDLINIQDLSNFFYDIWYPVADDINIFDESLDWLIFIRHDGAIYYLKNK